MRRVLLPTGMSGNSVSLHATPSLPSGFLPLVSVIRSKVRCGAISAGRSISASSPLTKPGLIRSSHASRSGFHDGTMLHGCAHFWPKRTNLIGSLRATSSIIAFHVWWRSTGSLVFVAGFMSG